MGFEREQVCPHTKCAVTFRPTETRGGYLHVSHLERTVIWLKYAFGEKKNNYAAENFDTETVHEVT